MQDSTGLQAQSSDPPYRPPSVPMYAAAILVTFAGIHAVNITMEDPTFGSLTIALTALGFLVSYMTRLQLFPAAIVELPAVALFGLICVMTVASDSALPLLTPASIGADRQKAMAIFLTWLVVLRSFTLSTDARLLFSCVPTIAQLGLMSTMNSDTALVSLFLMFLVAGVFMVVHEMYLSGRQSSHHESSPARGGKFLAGQVQLAAICFFGTVALGKLLTEPMRTIGGALIFNGALAISAPQRSDSTPTQFVQVQESSEYQVGRGPVSQSDQILMRVSSPRSSYWRGASFSVYTGQGWRNPLTKNLALYNNITARRPGDQIDPTLSTMPIAPTEHTFVGPKSDIVRQEFRLEPTAVFNQVYVAPEARTVYLPVQNATMDEAGAITVREFLRGVVYIADSQVASWTEDDLRRASTDYPAAIQANYTSLQPATVPQRLIDQAREVVATQKNAYDKVVALREWVSRRCLYNLQAAAVPVDQDVTDHFIFTSREGYCDSFATALAVMCRSVGIAARMASGFLPGDFDPDRGDYTVREKDKHAWTEVFFPGFGWVGFDATEGAEVAEESAGAKQRGKSLTEMLFGRGLVPPLALLAVLALLGYVLKVEVFDRLRSRNLAGNPLGLPETNYRILLSYQGASNILARRGHRRQDSQTPREYRLELEDSLSYAPSACAAMSRLTDLFVPYRYGTSEASEDEAATAEAAARTVHEEIRRAVRPKQADMKPAGGSAAAA